MYLPRVCNGGMCDGGVCGCNGSVCNGGVCNGDEGLMVVGLYFVQTHLSWLCVFV